MVARSHSSSATCSQKQQGAAVTFTSRATHSVFATELSVILPVLLVCQSSVSRGLQISRTHEHPIANSIYIHPSQPFTHRDCLVYVSLQEPYIYLMFASVCCLHRARIALRASGRTVYHMIGRNFR